MDRFTRLYLSLDRSPATTHKVAALRTYFEEAPAEDAAWALWFLTGRRFRRGVTGSQLRDWVGEYAELPTWLVDACYESVGDLAETLTLLTGAAGQGPAPTLHATVDRWVAPLVDADAATRRELVMRAWSTFDADQRFVWHKLIMGNFRVGVGRPLVTRALAEAVGLDPGVMAHRLSGRYDPSATAYEALCAQDDQHNEARPYPFLLASPLDDDVTTLGPVEDFLVECY